MSALNIFTKDKKKESKKKTLKKVEKKDVKKEKESVKKVTLKAKKKVSRVDSGAFRKISHPVISEKATFLAEDNKYVFEVAPGSRKEEIIQAIRDVYGVDPKKINVINIAGKNRRYGRKMGRTKDKRKAIVTLKEGQTIQVYEGV